MTDVLPALTLHQPWAYAIAHCGKDVENRTWPAPESVNQIMIHAGKAWDAAGMGRLRDLGCDITTAVTVTSAVVAVADLMWVCDAAHRRVSCGCGAWAVAGQYHWRLGNVRALPVPVPCRGFQRLWWPAAEVQVGVRAQLAAAVLP